MIASMSGIYRQGLALLAAAVAALAFAACGDEEPGSPGAGGSAPAEQAQRSEANAEALREYRERQEAAKPTEEEVAAQETATEFYEILGEDSGGAGETMIDSAAFCDLMSEASRSQTIRYARQASGEAREWDCESAIELLVLRSKQTGAFRRVRRARVIGVNAEGDRATASVRFGNGPVTTIPLVKEDSKWKLAASPAAGGR